MDAATVSAVVLPLVGVALGTAGTLTGQYLATRGDSRRHAAQLAAAARAERKQAISDFLSAAQRVERLIDNALHRGLPPDPAASDELLHDLWLAKKLLELVCGHELATAAHAFTVTMENLTRGRTEGYEERRRADRSEFIEAARRELGVDGPRLYPIRRKPAPAKADEAAGA